MAAVPKGTTPFAVVTRAKSASPGTSSGTPLNWLGDYMNKYWKTTSDPKKTDDSQTTPIVLSPENLLSTRVFS